jgi:hypothetical protein
MLFHETIRFAVPGKMNGMPLLHQVMAEMQSPGGMPQPFTTDNKQDLHGSFRSELMSLIIDELSP